MQKVAALQYISQILLNFDEKEICKTQIQLVAWRSKLLGNAINICLNRLSSPNEILYLKTTRVENRVYAQKNSSKEMIKRPKICLLPKYIVGVPLC